MTTSLWFIRHGEVDAAYVGTFVGRSEVTLSEMGRHQAAAIDVFLQQAGLDAILTSPRVRARETAAPLCEATELKAELRHPLAEMDFGAWEGRTWQEIEADDPDFAATWQADPTSHACPGGESAGDFAERVQQELQEILVEFEGRNVAIFGHAGVNRAILAHVIGIPYMQSFTLSQDYGCVNAAGWQADLAQVALMNFVPGPRSAMQGDGERVDE